MAKRELIALNEDTPQLEAVQAGAAGVALTLRELGPGGAQRPGRHPAKG